MNKDRENKKILIVTVVLGIVLFIIVAFSIFFFYIGLRDSRDLMVSSEYSTYDNYYVIITNNRETDFWQSVYEGAVSEAVSSGSFVELFGDNLDEDLTKEELIRIAINSNVDGIIVEGDNNGKATKLLKTASDSGIPVITVAEDNFDIGRKSYIGVNSYNLGKEYGEQIFKVAEEKALPSCNVLVLMDDSIPDSSKSVLLTAMREFIDEKNDNNKINIESQVIVSSQDYAAEEEIRDIFVSQSELPDIIVCLSEKNTVCAYQTVVDYNKVGEVEIIGYYMNPTINSAIEKDIIRSSIVIDTYQMGQNSIKALNEYRESGYASEIYLVNTKLVSKETLSNETVEGGDDNDEEDE